uniref:NADH-ubiquinone oxidoreductase chain 6 n=1 Tax=Glyptotermes sp. 18 AB-2022a TaxID=2942724 RepID=A0A8X8RHG6_9NEOP|nr:NADH dehydrogenase subunit 6 [Glyptotermes sp. 18 AB-2022a]
MKMLMTLSVMSSTAFTQMKHPLAMGMMLLMQTTIMCMISGLMYKSFWFQYILFMVFVGGMLVLFIYVTSLASNEMFSLSSKMLVTILMIPGMTLMVNMHINQYSEETSSYIMLLTEEIITSTSKLYNQPNGPMTILMVLYLFMTLIVVVKITNISKGPLRETK